MKQTILRVNETKYSEEYEDCSCCIHRKDTIEICILRKCVHAMDTLEDCYVPLDKLSESEEV